MLGITISKFNELVPVNVNKDQHRLHARLEQTPSKSLLQNSNTYTNFGAEPIFITMTLAGWRGPSHCFSSHVTILQINLSSMGLSISWWKISTVRSGVNSWGTDRPIHLLYDFPSVLLFWRCASSSDNLRVLFADFLPKLCVYSQYSIGGSPGDVKWRACDVEEAKEGLENGLWRRWSNGRIENELWRR